MPFFLVTLAPGSLSERHGRDENNPAITDVSFLFALELHVMFFVGPVL
jgi:hypothetical protein